ncbi:hypothetical protein ACSLVN_27355, partial [Klebsiella pneumoniae]|uniref:hypothetical protein n=1 Tax=Klebsiella pneumoniae TaxID=573 RepID=UPI003EDF03B8
AYVCSHVHAFDVTPLAEDAPSWQVVLGNGGSKLEKDWDPEGGTYFGFGVFDVYESGKIVLRNFRRPTPKKPLKYYEGAPAPAQPVTVKLYDPGK